MSLETILAEPKPTISTSKIDKIIDAVEQIGEHASYGVFVCNLYSLQLTYVNDIFASYFGLTRKQLMSKPSLLLSVLRTEEVGYMQRQHSKLLTEGAISDADFCIHLAGHEVRQLRCDAFSVDEFAAGLVKDITNSRSVNPALIDHTIRSVMMVKQVNTHLAAIRDMAKSLEPTLVLPGKAGSNISALISKIETALDLCEDANRAFIEKEHSAISNSEIATTRFDLVEHINLLLRDLRELTSEREIKFITNLRSLNISGDPLKLLHAVHDLVTQALLGSPTKSEITVVLESRGTKFIILVRYTGNGDTFNSFKYVEKLITILGGEFNTSSTDDKNTLTMTFLKD